ncbi:MAG: hypothetical protein LBL21_02255, partial [Rickettsiales bacterium]|nr:hypothetical protein [Rickettsiales bacterium]
MGQIASDIETILNDKQARKDAKSERQKLLAEMQRIGAEKTNVLKKALAAQRARFGAGGASGAGMSADAVLKRLESETAGPYEEKLRDAREKISRIK